MAAERWQPPVQRLDGKHYYLQNIKGKNNYDIKGGKDTRVLGEGGNFFFNVLYVDTKKWICHKRNPKRKCREKEKIT